MEEIQGTLSHILTETLEIRKELSGVRADLALLRQDVDNIRRWTHSNQNEDIIKKLDSIAHQNA